MYARGTILKKKAQRAPDPKTGQEFPYNRVEVMGESPVGHPELSGYTGTEAAGVIITPKSNFGGVLDEPYGKLLELYEVESIPEPVQISRSGGTVEVIDSSSAQAGSTPEEVFAAEAPGIPPEPGQTRARTRRSPLEDTNPKAKGPLDDPLEGTWVEPEPAVPAESDEALIPETTVPEQVVVEEEDGQSGEN